MVRRLRSAWRALDGDQRLAGVAAVALLATMFLPWYDHNFLATDERAFASENVSAFGELSFVEAAVFLVACGVFLLLFARGERRAFHLPGGDGTVIFAAGLWAALLLLWRVFDKPEVSSPDERYGIQWGFFFAFTAAGALAAAGWKIRAAHRPEPPLPKAEDRPAAAASPRRRRPAEPRTRQLTLDDAALPDEEETRVVEEPRAARRPRADEEETRVVEEPSAAPPPPRPRMPFDAEAADDDEPLRPGEIPRRRGPH